MKILIQILLLALMVGCASPYYPVYVSSEGDYYIAEQNTNGPYYGTNSLMLSDIGVYPWWVNGYPPVIFSYYTSYYYPYYFSVWYPPGYHPYYGFYGGYYAYWCPPYRIRRPHLPTDEKPIAGSPVVPPVAYSGTPVRNPELWRSIDRVAVNREIMSRRGVGWKTSASERSIPAYTRSTVPVSNRGMPSSRSQGFGRSAPRSGSRPVSTRSPSIHEQ